MKKAGKNESTEKEKIRLNFELGTFEGFNFRDQGAMWPNRTAEEVVNWDHDKNGEAEFWPAGDHHGVSLVFGGKSSVSASEIIALDSLLKKLGSDYYINFLEIYFSVHVRGYDLSKLSPETIEDEPLHIYTGSCFSEVRKEAAYELFENYYPDAYTAWEKSNCDGLIFDTDRFLDSPGMCVDEVKFGDQAVVIVVVE
jgi:hypothetical protein